MCTEPVARLSKPDAGCGTLATALTMLFRSFVKAGSRTRADAAPRRSAAACVVAGSMAAPAGAAKYRTLRTATYVTRALRNTAAGMSSGSPHPCRYTTGTCTVELRIDRLATFADRVPNLPGYRGDIAPAASAGEKHMRVQQARIRAHATVSFRHRAGVSSLPSRQRGTPRLSEACPAIPGPSMSSRLGPCYVVVLLRQDSAARSRKQAGRRSTVPAGRSPS